MGQFGDVVAGAKPSMGNGYWEEGKYLVQIDVCKAVKNKEDILCFIASGTALKSTNAKCPVGCTRDWVVKTIRNTPGPGNVKSFLMAASELDESEIDADGADAAVDAENPLHDAVVSLEVVPITTQAGNEFSKHVWSRAPKMKADELKKLQEAAGIGSY